MNTVPTRQGYYMVQVTDNEDEVLSLAFWGVRPEHSKSKQWYLVTAPDNDPTKEKTHEPLSNVFSFVAASKKQVEDGFKRELTHEEAIEKSYQSFHGIQSLYDFTEEHDTAVPENRRLVVGDEVELGALSDVRVVALHDGGQVVTVTARRDKGKGLEYHTRVWHSFVKVGTPRETKHYRPNKVSSVSPNNSSLNSVLSRYLRCGVTANTDYQRGYVWTPEDEQKFLDSVFHHRPLGTFVFVRNKYPKADELLDGKQRITTLKKFFFSQIPYKGEYWHEMSRGDRLLLELVNVSVVDLRAEDFTRKELLQAFLDLNTAGVPQTEEHLNKVRSLLEAAD